MLNAIIKWSLSHRLLVIGLTLAVVGFGIHAAFTTRVDVLPDLNKPVVAILTEGHGLAPEEVENLVTFPIESAINGVPGLSRLRSQSGIGLSVVWAEFDWGTDIWRVRQLIAERLANIKDQIPAGVEPLMAPVSSIMGEIFWVGLTSQKDPASGVAASEMDMRSYGEWYLRPKLLSIPGVSQVVVMGGGLKQAQVLLNPIEVNRRQLSLIGLRESLLKLGVNTSGGFLNKEGQEYLVRNIARPNDLEDIKKSVVGTWLGQPVQVQDIAKVEYGAAPARGRASISAEPGVILTIFKSPDADTLTLTKKIETLLSQLAPMVPPGIKLHENLFKQAEFIKSSIHNVSKSLVEGAVFVLIVLLLFLGSWRVSAITLTAIPFSFLATALVMKYMGFQINTMTLGGLAIASGELVDDAIVGVENVFRRIKEAREAGHHDLAYLIKVVFEASVEVRSSIVIATAIVILAFLPLLNMGGMEGRLFVPLGFSYIISILCSMAVSMTVTPVLASFILTKAKETSKSSDSWVLARLKKYQEANLHHVLRHPKTVIWVCGVLIFLALVGFMAKGKEFLPPFNETTNTVVFGAPPGISLEQSDNLTQAVEKTILSIPEVAATDRRTGRAEQDEHAEGVQKSEIDVRYKSGGRPREEVVKDIEQKLEKGFPGNAIAIGAPISHRIEHLLSGVDALVAIKIFGPDLDNLRLLAQKVVGAVKDIPGLVDVSAEQQALVPQVKVQMDRDRLKDAYLSSGETALAMELGFNGETVGTLIEGQRRVDIIGRLAPQYRVDVDAISEANLAILPDGSRVKVKDVADVFETEGANQVLRENMERRIVVKANVRGRSLSATVQDVETRLKALQLPQGYRAVLEGEYENQKQGQRRILLLGLVGFVAIFVLLFTHYKSWLVALQIMANVPLALVGSVAALYLAGGNISLASIVAFITLCGIASRNGILMVSHYIHLVNNEGEKFDNHMIIRGSLERLGPVLMTASTALLGLVPFLLEPHAPGREILYPVAVVIVGGLFSSTLLDLFVTPVLFSLTGRQLLAHGIFDPNKGGRHEKDTNTNVRDGRTRRAARRTRTEGGRGL